MNSSVAEIRSCEWLFLRTLEEPQDNALRIVVEEARAGAPADPKAAAEAASLPGLESILQGARLISHTQGCRVFEVTWPSYIAYSVRNESYVANDRHEEYEGRLLVKYTKSRFLDYVELGTFATPEYPGPSSHWGVICGNHVIDVVSTEEPEVRVLPNDA
jgi:hypothetical protein